MFTLDSSIQQSVTVGAHFIFPLFSYEHPRKLSPGISSFFRYLSSGEVSTALRPFYFSVHPDLFGQHPNERVSLLLHFLIDTAFSEIS